MSKKMFYLMSCVLVLTLSVNIVRAGEAYKDPAGGWRYIYTGDQLKQPFPEWSVYDTLDGSWTCGDGDSWDGFPIGDPCSSPGGISLLPDVDPYYIRMQDTGAPDGYDENLDANRGIYCIHRLAQDGLSTSITKALLNDGVTISFRARVSTGEPLDDLYTSFLIMNPRDPNDPFYDPCYIPPDHNDYNSEYEIDFPNDPLPWPEGGNGYGVCDGGRSFFNLVCHPDDIPFEADGDSYQIGFCLIAPFDTNWYMPDMEGRQGLAMNCNSGNIPNDSMDLADNESRAYFYYRTNDDGSGDLRRWGPFQAEGEINMLELEDVTQWHEFWINVQEDNTGGATHRVTIYTDGSYEPDVFHVTIGCSNNEFLASDYLGLGMPMHQQDGAVDIDFFAYKEGLFTPPSVQAVGPNPRNGETDVSRFVVLSWSAGDFAPETEGHQIFLSDDVGDMGEAGALLHDPVEDTPQDSLMHPTDGSSLVLKYGTTYFWRVDEANDTIGWDVGNIWQFTTESYTKALTYDDQITDVNNSSTAGEDPNNTVDGSGLDVNDAHTNNPADMWLSDTEVPTQAWIKYTFDKPYKLDKMWVWNYNDDTTLGINEAIIEYSVDDANYFPLGTTHTFTQADGSSEYEHNTEIDFQGKVAQQVRIRANSNHGGGTSQYGLSEVRFYYIPVRATVPYPYNPGSNIDPTDLVLEWTAGREAAQHEIYLSDNEDEVENESIAPIATIGTVDKARTTYDISSLDLQIGTTYYWKINEVNSNETPTEWAGDLWQFNTIDYFVVDNMDNYGDNSSLPWVPGGRIFLIWQDGWYDSASNPSNNTGSQIGHWDNTGTGISESQYVYNNLSMPYYYENDGDTYAKPYGSALPNGANPLDMYSEATVYTTGENSLNFIEDWESNGAKSISLWFYGDADNNDVDPNSTMYLAMEDTSAHVVVVKYDASTGHDPNDIKKARWFEWNIPLSEFSPTVDLEHVEKLHIGFGDRVDPKEGGKGLVFFDDIRLYPSRCMPSYSQPDGDLDNDCDVDYGDIAAMGTDWLVDDHVGTAELILHWKFDSNDGGIALDSSGYGLHGDINDANVAYDAAGQVDGCFDFNGLEGTHIILDTNALGIPGINDVNDHFDGLYGLTVSMWVKSNVTNTDNGFIVFDHWGIFPGRGDRRDIRYDSSGGYSGGDDVIICGVASTRGYQVIESEAYRQTTDWQHVAMTWASGDKVKLYINGALDSGYTAQVNCTGTTTGYNAVIVGKGKDDDDSDEGWDGKIDDVQIYNYALSQAEILEIMDGDNIVDKTDYHFALPAADLYPEAAGSGVVNFKDYAILVTLDDWLAEPMLWP